MRFSIIVPVYNVEKYLRKCIDSLIDQDYKDYEILLVNDGSTDESGNICEEYAQTNDRIRYLKKTNGGLSDTRNYGIEVAQGDYIIFVDSDDWIARTALSSFDEMIGSEPIDVLITIITEVFPDETRNKDEKIRYLLNGRLTKDEAFHINFELSGNPWPAQKKIVAKGIIDKYNLRFLKGKLHEDLDWTSRLFMCAETFAGISSEWYYHRMKREGSITTTITARNIVDTIEIASQVIKDFPGNSKKEKIIANSLMTSVYAKLNQFRQISKEEYNEVYEAVNTNMGIFRIAPKFKYKAFVFAMHMFGVKTVLGLLEKI